MKTNDMMEVELDINLWHLAKKSRMKPKKVHDISEKRKAKACSLNYPVLLKVDCTVLNDFFIMLVIMILSRYFRDTF